MGVGESASRAPTAKEMVPSASYKIRKINKGASRRESNGAKKEVRFSEEARHRIFSFVSILMQQLARYPIGASGKWPRPSRRLFVDTPTPPSLPEFSLIHCACSNFVGF